MTFNGIIGRENTVRSGEASTEVATVRSFLQGPRKCIEENTQLGKARNRFN